jgi:hypothetical protein
MPYSIVVYDRNRKEEMTRSPLTQEQIAENVRNILLFFEKEYFHKLFPVANQVINPTFSAE